MKLKDQITMYLKATNMRPYKLADLLGISRSVLYEFLRGRRDIRLSIAEKIRDYIER